MSDAPIADVNLAKELRLRGWARKNYVSAENRPDKWHPIVLDEMRKRDRELESRSSGQTIAGTFAPLPPTDLRRLDEAHESVSEPNLLHADSRQPLHLLYESRGGALPHSLVPRGAARGLWCARLLNLALRLGRRILPQMR